MNKDFNKLFTLSKQKLLEYKKIKDPFYKGNKTFQEGLVNEVNEAYEEIKQNNSVYLEDELGDILRTYIGLLHSLEDDGLISNSERVIERSYEKFSERITYMRDNNHRESAWDEIKILQKKRRKEEHENKYGKQGYLGR